MRSLIGADYPTINLTLISAHERHPQLWRIPSPQAFRSTWWHSSHCHFGRFMAPLSRTECFRLGLIWSRLLRCRPIFCIKRLSDNTPIIKRKENQTQHIPRQILSTKDSENFPSILWVSGCSVDLDIHKAVSRSRKNAVISTLLLIIRIELDARRSA